MTFIDILIADDHEFFRRNLRSLVESQAEWRVCDEAADGLEALEKTKALRPRIVLMDMSMPRMDGAEATRRIRREVPESQVIIVSQNDPALMRKIAAETGAHAFISKSDIVRDLIPAVLRITDGNNHRAALSAEKSEELAQNDWLFGGGHLASRIWEHDWSKTPLGSIQSWPQSLRTAVNLMLNSQHPMWIGWGPEMTFLYNDAYIPVLSLAKHPWALGRPASEVWAEIWDVCGPLADKVFSRGEPSFADDVRLFMNRGDYLEETYYSFSYSPVYDEAGKVAGLFCPSTEITPKVLNARRLRTLSDLSSKSMTEKSAHAAAASCVKTISANIDDIPFALLYLVDEKRKSAELAGASQIEKGLDGISPRIINLDGEAEPLIWPVREMMEHPQTQVISLGNVNSVPVGLANQRVREALVLPVTSLGMEHPIGVLIAGVNPTRKLDADYRTFFSLVADQVATSVQNATALQREKERADALAEVDRAKTMFFSNVSHEFRTPLTLMLGPLEDMLAESSELVPKQRERLDVAHRNSLRLLKLVNTLLDFSRIEAGRIQASYTPTNLGKLTNDLASVFRSAIERAGIRFTIDCESVKDPVYIDTEMWEKIVFNLLSNAFKFTFNGEIAVSLRKRAQNVELVVRDSGIGIPPAELTHLFERFYRVKGAQGRTFEGSGIGLALVQELAKLHNGSVTVESEPNRGSTFTISIPLGKNHLPADRINATRDLASTSLNAEPFLEEAFHWLPDPRGDSPASAIQSTSGKTSAADVDGDSGKKRERILLADDNADMREYVERLLGKEYEVFSVGDGEAAWESARTQKPDLILSDVMMPRLDGFGLLQRLRTDDSLKSVPVILLSARAGEESRIEGLQSGADDYLVKPFSARELSARVRSQLTLAGVRKESAELERKLREHSELLASIVASSDDAIVSTGFDGTITSWNKGAERMYGYTAAEAMGQNISTVVPPDRREEESRIFDQLRQGAKVDHFETQRVRKDQSSFDVSLSISPLRDAQGKIIGASEVARDITERRRAEVALQRAQEKLTLALESTTTAMFDWNILERQGSWNPQMTALYEFSPKAQNITAEEWRALFHPDEVNRLAEEAERFLKQKEKNTFEFEFRAVRPSGDIRWMLSHGRIERDADGRALRLIGMHTDITDRRRAEEAAHQHRARLEMVEQASQVGFWFCDLPFDKLLWDDRVKDHFWLPPDAEVTIETFYQRLHPDDRERTRQAMEVSIANDFPYDIEYRTVAPDGRQKQIHAIGRTFYDGSGKPKSFDGLTFDVTAQKTMGETTGLLAAIVNSSDDAIVSKNLDGVITSWNHAAERIFGYTAAEAIGQHITLIIPPDRLEEEVGILERIRRGERTDHFDTVRMHKDGSLLNISATISPVRDATGRIVGASKVARDITAQKQAEEREKRIAGESIAANAKFRAVFEQTSVFAGIMSKDGILIEANRLCLEACGYSAEEVLGKPFWRTRWWRDFKESQSKIREATLRAAQGIPYRETLNYSWADGTERLVDFALYPIVDDDGEVLYLHPTGVDITDLKCAEENYRNLAETLEAEVHSRTAELENRKLEVTRQAELLREFSQRLLQAQDEERRHIARELHDSAGQTLTVLGMTLAQLHKDTSQRTPDLASQVEMVQQCVQQLHSEIRTTSYLLHPPLLDETGLSSALNWYVQGLVERSELEISLDIAQNLGRLDRAMELAIFRLVQESLTNIHRHSGSKIASIGIDRTPELITVNISDRGKGMSPERLAEIQSGISGLGFRGMRERLRQFGATLDIESSASGTQIRVTIPLPKSGVPEEGNRTESRNRQLAAS